MNKQCIGCGVKLQDKNVSLIGYTGDLEHDYCARCYRLINYGEYKREDLEIDYISLFKKIEKTNDLVLYITDIINLSEDFFEIHKFISNPKILVINKADLLKNVNKESLINSFKNLNDQFLDYILVSSKNNYNLDNLIKLIKKYKNSNNVYVVGNANVGKSSLINKIIHNYSNEEIKLSTSSMPGTTLDMIKIKVDDEINLIDTPGLVNSGNLLNYVDSKELKRLNYKKPYLPKTYQIKEKQSIIIDKYLRIDYLSKNKNSINIYTSPNLKIERYTFLKSNRLKDKYNFELEIPKMSDLVIPGLGFIRFIDEAKIRLYIDINVKYFIRDTII